MLKLSKCSFRKRLEASASVSPQVSDSDRSSTASDLVRPQNPDLTLEEHDSSLGRCPTASNTDKSLTDKSQDSSFRESNDDEILEGHIELEQGHITIEKGHIKSHILKDLGKGHPRSQSFSVLETRIQDPGVKSRRTDIARDFLSKSDCVNTWVTAERGGKSPRRTANTPDRKTISDSRKSETSDSNVGTPEARANKQSDLQDVVVERKDESEEEPKMTPKEKRTQESWAVRMSSKAREGCDEAEVKRASMTENNYSKELSMASKPRDSTSTMASHRRSEVSSCTL